jgi:hypothetical protein
MELDSKGVHLDVFDCEVVLKKSTETASWVGNYFGLFWACLFVFCVELFFGAKKQSQNTLQGVTNGIECFKMILYKGINRMRGNLEEWV